MYEVALVLAVRAHGRSAPVGNADGRGLINSPAAAPTPGDDDGDLVANASDNCRYDYNPDRIGRGATAPETRQKCQSKTSRTMATTHQPTGAKLPGKVATPKVRTTIFVEVAAIDSRTRNGAHTS